MYVHRKANVTFLANPRTASRSTAEALLSVGFIMDGSHHSFDASRARGLIFAVVRDEAETLRSWGRHFRIDPDDTERILDLLERTRPIIPGWTEGLFPHAARATVVLAFSDLERELNELLEGFGLPRVKLPHIQ